MPVNPGHIIATWALVLCAVASSGCATDSNAAKGATKGAGTGALAGAVGAAATALIFGGDVGEAAARGAVYGGATGAVAGGLSGAEADRRLAEQERAEYERRVAEFREEIGSDAFNGFVALAECKYEVAVANAREAQRSRNRDYALAGLWVEALAAADRGDSDGAAALLPTIAERDSKLESIEAVATRLDETVGELRAIRSRHDLPPSCG